MKRKTKVTMSILVVMFLCLFAYDTFKNESTLLSGSTNKYFVGSVLLGGEETTLTDALNSAVSGDTITVQGEVTAESDVVVKNGVTLLIIGEFTIPTEYTFTNEGTVEVESSATFFIDGEVDLKYYSNINANGDVIFGENSLVTTSATETFETGNATITVGKTGLVESTSVTFEETENILFLIYGGEISTVLYEMLPSESIMNYAIYDETNNKYYLSFSEVPAGNTVKLIGTIQTTSDTIPADVTVVVPEGIYLDYSDTLTVNGTLKVSGGELFANKLYGTGTAILTPGYYNFSSKNSVYYVEVGDIEDTLTIDTINEEVKFRDLIFKVSGEDKNAVKTVTRKIKYSNKFSDFGTSIREHSYVATDIETGGEKNFIDFYAISTYKDMPNENFYQCVLNNYLDITAPGEERDINYAPVLADLDLEVIETLTCPGYDETSDENDFGRTGDITSVKGIDLLTNLETLDLSNNNITALDSIASNTNLTKLVLANNKIGEVNIPAMESLTYLDVSSNRIQNINISLLPNLTYLYAADNQINSVDLSANTALKVINLSKNGITEINLETLTVLESLLISNNNIAELDLTQNTNIIDVEISGNQITELNASNLSKLLNLNIGENPIQTLDISGCEALRNLRIIGLEDGSVSIESLDLSEFTNLETLSLSNIGLTEIDLTSLDKLEYLDVSENNLNSLNINDNTSLVSLIASDNNLSEIDLTQNTLLTNVNLTKNNISVIDLTANTKLESLEIANNLLKKLAVDNNTLLTNIDASNNQINKLDVTKLINLETLKVEKNNLTTLDLSSNTKLSSISINDNPFRLEILSKEGQTLDVTTLESPVKLPSKINEGTENEKIYYVYDNEMELSSGLTKEGNIITIATGGVQTISVDKDITFDSNGQYTSTDYSVDYNIKAPIIKSDVYTINDEKLYIYTGTAGVNEVLNNVVIEGGFGSVSNSKLLIKYNEIDETSVYEYNLVSFGLSSLNVVNKTIVVTEEKIFKDLKDELTNNILTLKLYSVGEGNSLQEETEESTLLVPTMKVEVYYDSDKLDTFTIVDDYLNVDELTIDVTNNIITNAVLNDTVESIESKIDTSGTIKWYDQADQLIEDTTNLKVKTGMKVKIELSNQVVEYTLSIKGDVTGTGESTISDVMRIVDHSLTDSKLTAPCYINAADVNNDGSISISDVMKLVDDLLS